MKTTQKQRRTHSNTKNSPINLLIVILTTLSYISVSFAGSTGATQLTTTLCTIYTDLNSIIPTVAFVLFVLAGLSYAGGQFFGAETRARATTWSMSMLTGAIIGLLITQFASIIITNLLGTGTKIPC